MATSGFDVLKTCRWSRTDQALLTKYFKGAHREWTKRTLAPLRQHLRTALLKKQKYACAYCRRRLSEELGHNEIDHIVPKALPGMARFTYERSNLVVACKRCNRNKGDYDPLAVVLGHAKPYPTAPAAYIWIHPYFHEFSKHIRIHDGLMFEAIGTGATKARANAVIRQCKLADLVTVERRRASEVAAYAVDLHHAILAVIGEYPQMDNSFLARAIKHGRKMPRTVSLIQIVDLVDKVRAGSFQSYDKGVRMLGI